MRNFLYIFLLSILFIYYLTDCASITPPSGGPRDTIPPVLTRSIPANKELNYSGNSIRLTFDEYLKIENLTKQLIITPIIQEEYEQKIRKNYIELTFPEPFKDSTTYTFNFQDAIQDITEGNVTLDNVLAFSTGDYIDSLYINGRVNEVFSNEPVEGYSVCLYYADDTLNLFNSPPVYLTKTNDEGKYLIENIKNGIYRLYVYNDANSNLICDMPREMFGFESDTIYLNDNIDSIFLQVQYLDMREIQIQRDGPAGQYYEIKTNKNLVDYSVLPIDTTQTIYHNFGEDKKTIRFYNNIHSKDSIAFAFKATDSLDQVFIDTLFMKFVDSKRDKVAFDVTFSPKNKAKILDGFKGTFQFNKPIIKYSPDSIYFIYDSVTFQYLHDSITSFKINEKKDLFSFDIELFFSEYLTSRIRSDTSFQKTAPGDDEIKPKNNQTKVDNTLVFHAGRGSFVSADNDSSAILEMEYQLLRPENFGIIKGTVQSDFENFTIQLLKGKKDVIDTIHNKRNYVFNHVEPGKYFIRVLIDNNGNGKWDPGNIFKNVEPEGIYFFTDEITIRPNWELTDIDLMF